MQPERLCQLPCQVSTSLFICRGDSAHHAAAETGNIPGWLFAGPPGSEDETLVEGLLAPFDCWSANALLILCLLECIVARLFPSLALQKQ